MPLCLEHQLSVTVCTAKCWALRVVQNDKTVLRAPVPTGTLNWERPQNPDIHAVGVFRRVFLKGVAVKGSGEVPGGGRVPVVTSRGTVLVHHNERGLPGKDTSRQKGRVQALEGSCMKRLPQKPNMNQDELPFFRDPGLCDCVTVYFLTASEHAYTYFWCTFLKDRKPILFIFIITWGPAEIT